MNRCVVLDAEALVALAGQPGRRNLEVRAHVAAAAVELGGGLVLTADPEDLGRLAVACGNVTVIGLP